MKRVAICTEKLARLADLPDGQAMLLQHPSPLHDIGKVAILHKPGKLTGDDWTTMQGHAQYGLGILHRSHRPLMQLGAEIAVSHHEH